MKLIIGTISFLTRQEDNIEEYTNKERLAIVHSIIATVECRNEDEAGGLGEEALTAGFDSYLIPEVYQQNGDIYFECSDNNLSITVEDFKKDYLT